jgi:hypothetical protein
MGSLKDLKWDCKRDSEEHGLRRFAGDYLGNGAARGIGKGTASAAPP